ncbi:MULTISPECIES: LysR family transcriptional regulator [unclassified Marinovum]
MIKLQHIEMLLAIQDCGSIRAAAKAMGRTQPALTKALRQAEADLGAVIFQRGPSGVAVTELGAPVLKRATVIQAELRKLQEEVDQISGISGGRINVTVSPLGAIRFVPEAVKRFRRRYPDTHLQISGGHEPMAFAPLRDGKTDVVIGPAPSGNNALGLRSEPLTMTSIVIATGATSRWLAARSLRDLEGAEWIMIGARGRQPLSQQAFLDLGIPPPRAVVHSDSMFSVLAMIQDSDYLCTFPGQVMTEFQRHWRIATVPVAETVGPAQIAVTTASDRPLTPATRYFCDCVLHLGD